MCADVVHEGFESFMDMKNGVLQGCTLAPILWSLYSVFLLRQIEEALESSWPREQMTLYADDTHCAWRLQSEQDLNFMIKSALAVFDVYRRYGMRINPDKSTLIIKLGGTHGAKWLKQHIHLQDGKRVFMFQHGTSYVSVPISKQAKYLGIMVSYQNFEQASLQHRLKAAGLARQRLAKVLHCSKYLSMRQRLQIYAACIRATFLHGLTTIGLSDKDLRQLHRRDIKYLRAVAKSPVHHTREPAEQLFKRLQVNSIRQVFLKLGGTTTEAARFANNDYNSNVLDSAARVWELDGVLASCACPTCGIYFPPRQIMKIHHSRKHGTKLSQQIDKRSAAFKTLDISAHCVDGMPVCKHCGLGLSGWQEFRSHILNACPGLSTTKLGTPADATRPDHIEKPDDETERLAQRSAAEPLLKQIKADPEQMEILQGPQWYKLIKVPYIKELLLSHCACCGQWISDRSGSLENHLKSAHPNDYKTRTDVRSVCQVVPAASPVLVASVEQSSNSVTVAHCCSIYATSVTA